MLLEETFETESPQNTSDIQKACKTQTCNAGVLLKFNA